MRILGLALSGGGARSFAHIGVLRKFIEAEFPIRVISGTSMGGIIAAAYALGFSLDEIEQRAIKLSRISELVKLLDPTPPMRGYLEGIKVRAYIQEWFGDSFQFSDCQIPLALTAVDLVSRKEVTLDKGNLLPALWATCAFPGLFPPVEIGNLKLVDGGVLNNLPLKQARGLGADFLVGSDVQFINQSEFPSINKRSLLLPQFFWDFYRAELIMVEELTRREIEIFKPDILVYPEIPDHIDMFFGFRQAKEIIEAGAKAVENILLDINKNIFYY